MTNVSKKKLKNEVTEKINKQLIEVISNIKNLHSSKSFTDDFFTDSEKTMFAKRLAVIFLLSENVPFSVIKKGLKVSSSTLSNVATALDNGFYKGVLKNFKNKKEKDTFRLNLEVILRMGMPPIVGKGRWKALDDYIEKHNRVNFKK